jgi:hypothetical protein
MWESKGAGGRDTTLIVENRLFDNGVGVLTRFGSATIARNQIYSNSLGLRLGVSNSSTQVSPSASNNLLYDNSNGGVRVEAGFDVELVNNTIVQTVGDAIRIEGMSRGTRLVNNVLWVEAGYAISVRRE